jgi:hypothetical protein
MRPRDAEVLPSITQPIPSKSVAGIQASYGSILGCSFTLTALPDSHLAYYIHTFQGVLTFSTEMFQRNDLADQSFSIARVLIVSDFVLLGTGRSSHPPFLVTSLVGRATSWLLCPVLRAEPHHWSPRKAHH